MSARRFIRQTTTIARREFMSTVGQPAFLFFLLSPLLLAIMGLVAGTSMDGIRSHSLSKRQMIMIAGERDGAAATVADRRLRRIFSDDGRATLTIVKPARDVRTQAEELLAQPSGNVVAVLYGPMSRPTILHLQSEGSPKDVRYLSQMADQTMRTVHEEDLTRRGVDAAETSEPTIRAVRPGEAVGAVAEALGGMSVMLIFLATYMLSSHIATGFAEERTSKIVEILASSASLESVFFGKLVGELAIAALFVGFWLLIVVGIGLAAISMGGSSLPAMDGAEMLGAATGGAFPILFLVYFLMSYLINSCTILGIASLAPTPRSAAIMNLPFTLLQFGMMSLSTYAAMHPATPTFYAAVFVPFSSPLTMVSQAAMSPSLAPHLMAIAWQAVWVVVIVNLAARAFRRGALGSASAPMAGRARRIGKAPAD